MKYQPIVSIIIPVYNGSNFLKQAIESALEQTYKNCEILVINDGSSDNGESEKIALSFGNKIKYFYKENGGVSSALNFAFSKMTGDWFSWLSHDDLYYPEKIERQIKYINELIEKESNINLEKITIRCATESIDKYGNIIRIPSFKNIPEYDTPINIIIKNVYSYKLSGCSFLLPSACVKDVGGFNEDIRTVSDVEYWYRLLFAGYDFYCMKNDRLVKNRSHKQQVGKKKVNLFEKELNDLHISFANKIVENKYENIDDVLMRFYKGLRHRNMTEAMKYVKKNLLKGRLSFWQYYIIVPLSSSFEFVTGKIRNVIRTVYRCINVK